MRSGYPQAPDLFPISENETRFGMIRGTFDKMMVDEAAIMGGDQVAPDMDNTPAYVGLALSEKKLLAVLWAFAFMLALILLRAAYVQVANGAEYVAQAEGNRSRVMAVPTERGVMYDKTGRPLVRNVPDFSVSIVPADLPKDPAQRLQSIGRIAVILDLMPADIEAAMNEFKEFPATPITVADNLTHDQAVRVSIEEMHTPGVTLVTGTRREYNATGDIPSLSHALGYEGRLTKEELDAVKGLGYQPSDLIGKTGLEKTYEDVLRGDHGERRIEVDSRGRQKSIISEDAGTPGKNLVLTIDLDLQREVERVFRAQLEKAGKRRGSVIVMNPNNGDVLALVSEPAFDANAFAKGISTEDYAKLLADPDRPMFSRAISGEVASGSVFKPVVAAGAITEGIVDENTSVVSTGGLRLGAWFFPDWKGGGHGVTNLAKALAESVNTWFYTFGGGTDSITGLGIERITEYARKFGFGSPTGIDLPNEADGFLPSKEWKKETTGENWYIGNTYNAAIGQGDIIVTPIQVATMTAAFANGGTLLKPRMVSAITTADGQREEREVSIVKTQVVPKRSVDAVRRGMRQAVTSGSARSLSFLPVQAAGKTGTAQWNSKKDNHAWFTSFAPYEKPEIVVTVMIEEGVEGSLNATPVARQIYEWYFKGRGAAAVR